MQKKLIVSLLATPMAFGAMADITVVDTKGIPANGWTVDGGLPGAGYKNDAAEASVSGVVGTATIVQTIAPKDGFPAGTYKIVFNNGADNVKIQVQVPGVTDPITLTADGEGKVETGTFKLAQNVASVTLLVSSDKSANTFSFAKAEIVLDLNVNDINAAVQTAIDDLTATLVKIKDQTPELSATATDLVKQYNDLVAAIAKVGTDNKLTDPVTIEQYKKLNLAGWPTTDAIHEALKALADGDVKTYNEKATAENNRYANQTKWDQLLADMKTDMQDVLDAVKTGIEADAKDFNAEKAETLVGYVYTAGNEVVTAQAAAQKVIDDYKADLEAIYKGHLTETPATLEAKLPAVPTTKFTFTEENDKYKQLAGDYLKDAEAYYVTLPDMLSGLKTSLETQYNLATTNLFSVEGVNYTEKLGDEYDYSTVLYKKVAEWQAAITAANDKAVENINNALAKGVKGAYTWLTEGKAATTNPEAAAIPSCQSMYDAAIAEFNKINDKENGEWNVLLAEQKAIMDKYVPILAEMVTDFASVQTAFASTTDEDTQKQIADIETAIKGLNEYIDGNYPPLTLDEATLADMVKNINTTLGFDQLKSEAEAIINLNNDLDALKKYIKNLCDTNKLPSIYDKFGETFDAIQEGINSLKPGSPDADLQDVKDGIANAKATADDLVGYFVDANAYIVDTLGEGAGITGLNGIIDGDTYLYGSAVGFGERYKADKDGLYAKLLAAIANFRGQYNAALAEGVSPQDCYTKAKALDAAIAAYAGPDLKTVLLDYQVNSAEANVAAAQTALKAETTAIAQYDAKIKAYEEENNVSLGFNLATLTNDPVDGIQDEIDALTAKITELNNPASYDPDAENANTGFDAVDLAVGKDTKNDKDEITKLSILNEIAALHDDVQAATDLVDRLLKVYGTLDELRDYNKNYTVGEDAKEHWTGVIDGYEDTIEDYISQIKTIISDPKQSLSGDNYDELKGKIQQFTKLVNKTDSAIQQNQDAYNTLLEDAQSTSSYINSAIDMVNASTDDPEIDATKIPGWLAQLNVQLNELAKINRNTGKYYNNGQFADTETDANHGHSDHPYVDPQTQTDAYKAIRDAVAEILNQVYGEDGIQALNNGLLEAWNNSGYVDLRNQYIASVDAYNQYSSWYLGNIDYCKYINNLPEVKATHEELYQYAAKITALNQALIDEVTKANTAGIGKAYLVTEEWFQENIVDVMEQYQTNMTNLVTAMQAAAAAGAQTYMQTHTAAMQTLIGRANTIMTTAGVAPADATGYLKDANAVITKVNTEYAKDLANFNKGPEDKDYIDIVKACDGLATMLDGVNDKIQSGTLKGWSSYYAAKKAALGRLAAAVATYTYIPADDEDLAAFNAAKAVIEGNDLVETPTSEKIEGLANAGKLLEDMPVVCDEDALINITKYLDALKDYFNALNSNINTATTAEAALKVLNGQLEEVAGFPNAVESLEELYKKLQEFDNSLAGDINSNKASTIETDIALVKNAIDNAKTEDGYDEDVFMNNRTMISGLINQAKADIASGYGNIVNQEYMEFFGTGGTVETPKEGGIFFLINLAYNNCRDVYDKDGKPVPGGYFDDEDDAKAWNAKIDALKQAVYDLTESARDKSKPDGTGLSAPADYVAKAQQYEQEACQILADLQAKVAEHNDKYVTDLAQTIAKLTSQYEEVSAAIAAGKAGVNELVASEFDSKYDELLEELNALQTEWSSPEVGSWVIMTADNYEAAMDAIKAKVDPLNKKAKFAADNLIILNDLNASLDAVKDALDALVKKAKEFKVYTNEYHKTTLDQLALDIKTLGDDIKDQYNDVDHNGLLDSETNFNNQISTISNRVSWAEYDVASDYFNKSKYDFSTARNNAYGALRQNVVNKQSYYNQLEDIYNEYSKLIFTQPDEEGNYTVPSEFDNAWNAINANDKLAYMQKVAGWAGVYEDIAAKIQELVDQINSLITEINENTYVPGEVNGEEGVNVADLQTLINWVGEGLTFDDIKSEKGAAIAAAADITGDDKINILDITGLVQILKGYNVVTPNRVAAKKATAMQTVAISMATMGEVEDGVRRYAVLLNNQMSLCAGQMDIQLPAGCELVNVSLSDRAESHDIARFDNAEGARVIITSIDNASFNGDGGQLVFIDVRGNGTPSVGEAIFSDSMSNGFIADNKGLTFIDSIYETAREVKDTIYNVAGQTMRAVQRGINIIRHSDGTTSKEIRK